MNHVLFFIPGMTPVIQHTADTLIARGIQVTSKPEPDVSHLLLPIPSFTQNGEIKSGGLLEHILTSLPEAVTVMGGNLAHPILQAYRTIDFLQDYEYLAQNAAITADCAIRTAAAKLKTVFAGCPVLIIGWGRIGKCLANQLKALSCDVTVASRKDSDRAITKAMGFKAANSENLTNCLIRYRVIFNTVPFPILNESQLLNCNKNCLKIDLASTRGIAGDDVIHARGLPGLMAPESTGKLIANTAIRYLYSGRNLP